MGEVVEGTINSTNVLSEVTVIDIATTNQKYHTIPRRTAEKEARTHSHPNAQIQICSFIQLK